MIADAAASVPTPQGEIFIAQLGGAMARVKACATAFVARDARYIMNVHGRWSDAADDERVRARGRVAHSFDYLTGDVTCLSERVGAVLPAWSTDMPGYAAVLAMQAFSLEEAANTSAPKTSRAPRLH